MVATVTLTRNVKFTGRNGYFNAKAIEITRYDPIGNILITPITTKGMPARCDIEVPVEDIPQLIEKLMSFTDKEIDINPQDTHIASITTQHTGGHIYNDVITLKDGTVIRISGEMVVVFCNQQADDDCKETGHIYF